MTQLHLWRRLNRPEGRYFASDGPYWQRFPIGHLPTPGQLWPLPSLILLMASWKFKILLMDLIFPSPKTQLLAQQDDDSFRPTGCFWRKGEAIWYYNICIVQRLPKGCCRLSSGPTFSANFHPHPVELPFEHIFLRCADEYPMFGFSPVSTPPCKLKLAPRWKAMQCIMCTVPWDRLFIYVSCINHPFRIWYERLVRVFLKSVNWERRGCRCRQALNEAAWIVSSCLRCCRIPVR